MHPFPDMVARKLIHTGAVMFCIERQHLALIVYTSSFDLEVELDQAKSVWSKVVSEGEWCFLASSLGPSYEILISPKWIQRVFPGVNHCWASKTGRLENNLAKNTSKTACAVLEQSPMDNWVKDQFVAKIMRRAWQRGGTAQHLKCTTSTVKHIGSTIMALASVAANRTESLKCNDGVTAG